MPRLVAYQAAGVGHVGFLEGEEIAEAPLDPGGADLAGALRSGGDGALERLRSAATRGPRRHLAEVEIGAPLVRPSKVLCVGQNYAEHAAEAGAPAPTEPIFFAKLPSAIIGPTDTVNLPTAAPRRVDYEAELAVVIGRRGRDIAEGAAMDFVLGYTVANDVTARDWQIKKPGGQWLLGKSFDTFLPLGPWLVTADEIRDVGQLRITCTIGGETLQDGTAGGMIFSIPELIAYVSRVATLLPGDVLLTGTPAGTGMSRKPPRWLGPGDLLETAISGIGSMANPVSGIAVP